MQETDIFFESILDFIVCWNLLIKILVLESIAASASMWTAKSNYLISQFSFHWALWSRWAVSWPFKKGHAAAKGFEGQWSKCRPTQQPHSVEPDVQMMAALRL